MPVSTIKQNLIWHFWAMKEKKKMLERIKIIILERILTYLTNYLANINSFLKLLLVNYYFWNYYLQIGNAFQVLCRAVNVDCF